MNSSLHPQNRTLRRRRDQAKWGHLRAESPLTLPIFQSLFKTPLLSSRPPFYFPSWSAFSYKDLGNQPPPSPFATQNPQLQYTWLRMWSRPVMVPAKSKLSQSFVHPFSIQIQSHFHVVSFLYNHLTFLEPFTMYTGVASAKTTLHYIKTQMSLVIRLQITSITVGYSCQIVVELNILWSNVTGDVV